MAPSKIVQTRGGWPFFEVDVTAAKANPADVATLVPAPAPAGGRGGGGGAPGGAPAPLTVTSEKLGDGLYRLTTGPGSYDSVIVEFKDYIMMLEAGQSEARGLAYIAETKKLIPNKPIRYVMNTHPHADHTGGLPAAGGRRRNHHHAEEQRGVSGESAQHAENAAERHAREKSEESQDRSRCGEEGLSRMGRAPWRCTTSLRFLTRTA